MPENQGLQPEEIRKFQNELNAGGKLFRYIDEDEVSDEMAEFFFVGMHEGKEVIFDCLLGTLRLAYESNLLEMAEARTKAKFPDFRALCTYYAVC